MSYQVKRIDPFGFEHPLVKVLAVGGVLLAVSGLLAKMVILVSVGGAMAGVGILASTKPTVSAALGVLGLLGGLLTFVALPNVQMADLSLPFRFLAALLFAVLYTVLMDAVVLVAAYFYNLFSAFMGGIHIDLQEDEAPEAE